MLWLPDVLEPFRFIVEFKLTPYNAPSAAVVFVAPFGIWTILKNRDLFRGLNFWIIWWPLFSWFPISHAVWGWLYKGGPGNLIIELPIMLLIGNVFVFIRRLFPTVVTLEYSLKGGITFSILTGAVVCVTANIPQLGS